jgi:hypothetical protein
MTIRGAEGDTGEPRGIGLLELSDESLQLVIAGPPPHEPSGTAAKMSVMVA